jgi:hypothetical protein
MPGARELRVLAERLPEMADLAKRQYRETPCTCDYLALVETHNQRRKRRG